MAPYREGNIGRRLRKGSRSCRLDSEVALEGMQEAAARAVAVWEVLWVVEAAAVAERAEETVMARRAEALVVVARVVVSVRATVACRTRRTEL